MKTTVSLSDFRDSFRTMDRKENFTYEGLELLFDYLEEYEESTGDELELDVIALCCDYYEDTPKAIADNYSIDISECADDDEVMDTVLEYLNNETMVIGNTDSTIIYGAF